MGEGVFSISQSHSVCSRVCTDTEFLAECLVARATPIHMNYFCHSAPPVCQNPYHAPDPVLSPRPGELTALLELTALISRVCMSQLCHVQAQMLKLHPHPHCMVTLNEDNSVPPKTTRLLPALGPQQLLECPRTSFRTLGSLLLIPTPRGHLGCQ